MAANPFVGKATQGEGGNWEIPSADTHDAVLVGFIDLGSHTESFKDQKTGEKKYRAARQCVLVWELVDAPKKTGGNHFIAKRYSLSFHEKANIRKDFEAYRRKKYGEAEQIDYTRALGLPWAIDISHQPKKGDEKTVYANISKVGPLKAGAKVAMHTQEPFCWFIGCPEPIPDFDWLPRIYGDRIPDLIRASKEVSGSPTRPVGESEGEPATVGAGTEDEIPF